MKKNELNRSTRFKDKTNDYTVQFEISWVNRKGQLSGRCHKNNCLPKVT